MRSPLDLAKVENFLNFEGVFLLFGAGNIDLLKNPSIGIVGSRDIDMNTEAYVKKAVDKICQNNFSIISGAAKGVDITAMDHTLSNGNIVIGILASDLTKKMRDLSVINYIDENQLLLLSMFVQVTNLLMLTKQ